MRPRRRSALATTVALGLGSLGLFACGSSSDQAAVNEAAPTSEAPTSEAPTSEASTSEASTSGTPGSEAPAAPATEAPATSVVDQGSAEKSNIFFTAVGAGNFLTLAKLLTNAELLDTIKGPGPFTVFAPTDAAFAKVPAATLEALAADKAKLTKVLLYHVVPGTLTSKELQSGEVATAEGSKLRVNVAGSSVTVNDVRVLAPDVMASNGVIHVIDNVLLPPDLG